MCPVAAFPAHALAGTQTSHCCRSPLCAQRALSRLEALLAEAATGPLLRSSVASILAPLMARWQGEPERAYEELLEKALGACEKVRCVEGAGHRSTAAWPAASGSTGVHSGQRLH